jgi:hypothetical protein
MRRAFLLSVVLASGCHQASAPAVVDAAAKNAAKANKEMSDLFRKADALAAANDTPVAANDTPPAAAPIPPQPSPSGNAPVAPEGSEHPTPAKSKTDVMRDQATAAFGDRLRSLHRTAEATRLKKDRYLQVCQGNAAAKSECQSLTTDVADASRTIERELGDIEEAARRARIDSGVMRDLLAKYGF